MTVSAMCEPGLGVPGPELKVPGADGDQDGAQSQEVAKAGDVEQVQPAPGHRPDGHDGGDRDAGRHRTVQRGHPRTDQEGQPGGKAPDQVGHRITP